MLRRGTRWRFYRLYSVSRYVGDTPFWEIELECIDLQRDCSICNIFLLGGGGDEE